LIYRLFLFWKDRLNRRAASNDSLKLAAQRRILSRARRAFKN
jgi:hypothetical protein